MAPRCCSCTAAPGPAAGTVHRRFFDPAHWRVVIFDQRGAGRSRPLGSLAANTTPDLVADIETLRRHLGIEQFLLFGGSWGSTLALAYAQSHPERVSACVLRGVFLGRPVEVEWFLHGIATLFPDAHAAFAGHLPEAERGDLLGNYLRRLTDPDPMVHLAAGTRLVGLRGLLQHAAAQPGHRLLLRAGPHGVGPRPASRRITSRTTCSCRRAACSPICTGWPASPPRSCRAATT